MAQVDLQNPLVDRFSVWHHRFDPETNHFKWFLIDCFDSEKEMDSLLRELWVDLERRAEEGEVHHKEQFVGRIRKSSIHKYRFWRR
jgi:hypothetical protein